MTSRTAKSFWRFYPSLPAHVRRQARKAFRQFKADPYHSSLHFKPLKRRHHCWSARISSSYRAVCRRQDDTLHWFWIGSHADFDRAFA